MIRIVENVILQLPQTIEKREGPPPSKRGMIREDIIDLLLFSVFVRVSVTPPCLQDISRTLVRNPSRFSGKLIWWGRQV